MQQGAGTSSSRLPGGSAPARGPEGRALGAPVAPQAIRKNHSNERLPAGESHEELLPAAAARNRKLLTPLHHNPQALEWDQLAELSRQLGVTATEAPSSQGPANTVGVLPRAGSDGTVYPPGSSSMHAASGGSRLPGLHSASGLSMLQGSTEQLRLQAQIEELRADLERAWSRAEEADRQAVAMTNQLGLAHSEFARELRNRELQHEEVVGALERHFAARASRLQAEVAGRLGQGESATADAAASAAEFGVVDPSLLPETAARVAGQADLMVEAASDVFSRLASSMEEHESMQRAWEQERAGLQQSLRAAREAAAKAELEGAAAADRAALEADERVDAATRELAAMGRQLGVARERAAAGDARQAEAAAEARAAETRAAGAEAAAAAAAGSAAAAQARAEAAETRLRAIEDAAVGGAGLSDALSAGAAALAAVDGAGGAGGGRRREAAAAVADPVVALVEARRALRHSREAGERLRAEAAGLREGLEAAEAAAREARRASSASMSATHREHAKEVAALHAHADAAADAHREEVEALSARLKRSQALVASLTEEARQRAVELAKARAEAAEGAEALKRAEARLGRAERKVADLTVSAVSSSAASVPGSARRPGSRAGPSPLGAGGDGGGGPVSARGLGLLPSPLGVPGGAGGGVYTLTPSSLLANGPISFTGAAGRVSASGSAVAEVAAAQAEARKAANEAEYLRSQWDEEVACRQKLEEALEAAHSAVAREREALEEAESAARRREEECRDEADSAVEAAQTRLGDAEAKLAAVEGEAVFLRRRVEALEGEADSASKERREAEDEVVRLQAAVATMEEALAAATAEARAMREANQSIENRHTRSLDQARVAVEETLRRSEAKAARLEEEAAAARSQLAETRAAAAKAAATDTRRRANAARKLGAERLTLCLQRWANRRCLQAVHQWLDAERHGAAVGMAAASAAAAEAATRKAEEEKRARALAAQAERLERDSAAALLGVRGELLRRIAALEGMAEADLQAAALRAVDMEAARLAVAQERLTAMFGEETRAMREAFDTSRAVSQEEHEARLQAEQRARAEDARRAEEALARERAEHERELAEAVRSALAEAEEAHTAAMDQMVESMQAQMEATVERLITDKDSEREHAVADAVAEWEERLREATDDWAERYDAMMEKLEGQIAVVTADKDEWRHECDKTRETVTSIRRAAGAWRLWIGTVAARALTIRRTLGRKIRAVEAERDEQRARAKAAEDEVLFLEGTFVRRSHELEAMREGMRDTLTASKREQLMTHKVEATRLQGFLARLEEEERELDMEREETEAWVKGHEETVRAKELELRETSEQSNITADGRVDMAVARRKRRLHSEHTNAVARLAEARQRVAAVNKKQEDLEERRSGVLGDMQTSERALTTLLMEQQRGLLAILKATGEPAFDRDARNPDTGALFSAQHIGSASHAGTSRAQLEGGSAAAAAGRARPPRPDPPYGEDDDFRLAAPPQRVGVPKQRALSELLPPGRPFNSKGSAQGGAAAAGARSVVMPGGSGMFAAAGQGGPNHHQGGSGGSTGQRSPAQGGQPRIPRRVSFKADLDTVAAAEAAASAATALATPAQDREETMWPGPAAAAARGTPRGFSETKAGEEEGDGEHVEEQGEPGAGDKALKMGKGLSRAPSLMVERPLVRSASMASHQSSASSEDGFIADA